jgi:hypothetical protein
MPLTVQCPGCGKQLHAKEELLGRKVKCPACSRSSILKLNEAVALIRKEFFLSPVSDSGSSAAAVNGYAAASVPSPQPATGGEAKMGLSPSVASEPPKPTGAIRSRHAELQRAADQHAVKGSLRGTGIGSIIFGILAVVVGLTALQASAMNLVLVVLGAVLAIEGTFVSLRPRPGGLIFDGLALILVGTWNIVITVIDNIQAAGPGNIFWGIMGGFQWIWGIQRILYYRRFAKVQMQEAADPLVVSWLEQTLAKIKALSPKKDANAVEFLSTNFFGNWKWKGLLQYDGAVFMMITGGSEILIAPKESLTIEAKMPSKLKPKKLVNFTLQSGEHKVKGKITVEQILRLKAWQEQ